MTALASLESTDALDDSVALVLHDVRHNLEGESIRDIGLAIRLGVLAIAGDSPAEIRERLGLSEHEYTRLKGLLRRAVRP